MKKYIIFALMLLSAGSVMAQSGMTDDQVMSFVAKEHSAGTSNFADCHQADAAWCRHFSDSPSS